MLGWLRGPPGGKGGRYGGCRSPQKFGRRWLKVSQGSQPPSWVWSSSNNICGSGPQQEFLVWVWVCTNDWHLKLCCRAQPRTSLLSGSGQVERLTIVSYPNLSGHCPENFPCIFADHYIRFVLSNWSLVLNRLWPGATWNKSRRVQLKQQLLMTKNDFFSFFLTKTDFLSSDYQDDSMSNVLFFFFFFAMPYSM